MSSTRATTPVRVHLAFGTLGRLQTVIKAEKARGRAFLVALRSQLGADAPERSAAERAAARARARARLAELRRDGELTDTRDVLVTHALRAELAARGWDHDWPPPPADAPGAGRWPGSIARSWPESLTVRLPADLAAQLQRACAHVSAPAVAAVRVWRDAHPGIITPRTDPALWEEYQRLAADVITPGDVLRAAVARALPHPPQD
ncbi:hypothetical protein DMB42_52120 [Nonomuraea sp. WAC 01424]|uniref:hypothetical protein n=1 Tax=Nonomuraea sp. WAC 01424 TaxID=2203200 RepID=UPI000F78ECC1|nr:hypothetical protein [Nonomuraea sp. WAC 01424]RSM93780.1 hypothetical protein DMB42_52120 [Nonomuraea sp. WAC 01424]